MTETEIGESDGEFRNEDRTHYYIDHGGWESYHRTRDLVFDAVETALNNGGLGDMSVYSVDTSSEEWSITPIPWPELMEGVHGVEQDEPKDNENPEGDDSE
jgi:hypothetical protein